MGKGLKGLRGRVFLMTKVCTHGRDKHLAMSPAEMQALRDCVRQYAADGRFELYKLSLKIR